MCCVHVRVCLCLCARVFVVVFRYFLGGFCVYSGPAARALLPVKVIEQSGMAEKSNYSGLHKYVSSKKRYTEVLAKHIQKEYKATW